MGEQQRYKSTIKSRPYFYMETKKLAELVLQGINEVQLKEQVINQNILQVKSESRKREMASAILKRLKTLDEFLTKQLTMGDVNTSKLITLYAIIKTDRLFYEFMNDVFKEKIAYQELILTDRDFNTFFENKRQQSDTVASWTDYTFYKLQQVYIRILFEAGLLKGQKTNREIVVPMMNPDVLAHIRKIDDPRFINVMTGGS